MRTKNDSPAAGITIAKVRPHWGAVLTAVLVALALSGPAGIGVGVVAGLLTLLVSAAYQGLALLGYIAGALTPDQDEDEDEVDEADAHV